jgi:hypothetical protein
MIGEKNTNIFEVKNYNAKLSVKTEHVLIKFKELINEYLYHLTENIIIQNKEYYLFILLRGLNTIKHIFNTLLLYTKNLDLTVYHTKKAYLFFVEFIGQIGDDNNSYLQLNSKDATLFCYKKTIFEINNEYRIKYILNENEKDKFEYINIFSQLTIELFKGVINNQDYIEDTKMNYMMYIQKMINKILDNLINLNEGIPQKLEIIDKYSHYKNLLKNKKDEMDDTQFFNLSILFFKKIQNKKNISKITLSNKMYNNRCNSKLESETALKFTNWLFNGK